MSRALVLVLALALANTGCFTSWAVTQATGTERLWEEGARTVSVPQPGVTELLAVTLPTRPVQSIHLTCVSSQRATDRVHTAAFRYGKKFKLVTAVAFAVEGALGAAFVLTADRDHSANYVYGGVLGLDALGTAAMLLFPRKEVVRAEDRPVTTELHTMCPDGLVLEVAGDTFPVDAIGGIGDLGEAALDAWMAAPRGSLLVSFAGRTHQLHVGPPEQCAWRTAREGADQAGCTARLSLVPATTTFEVPLGTLGLAQR